MGSVKSIIEIIRLVIPFILQLLPLLKGQTKDTKVEALKQATDVVKRKVQPSATNAKL